MKHIKILSYIALSVTLLVASCKDEFSEEDMLNEMINRSKEQAKTDQNREDSIKNATYAANIEALNLAGNLLDYTVTVHSDDAPIAGATVSATNQQGTVLKKTTDANGNATFTDIQLGGHTIAITSPDYLDVSYLVDFGKAEENIHYKIVNGVVIPIDVSEASKIELFALNGLQTATIKGVAEIETILTNSTPEIPQGITVRANLDNNGMTGEHSYLEGGWYNSIYVAGSFTFTQGDIGEAAVDVTTGEYSMTIPASDEGTEVELLIPLVEADQMLAYSEVNGEYVGEQVGLQPAYFGPGISAPATPVVSGVRAEFPAPAEPGRGFSVTNLQPMPRDLSINPITTINDFPVENNVGGVRFIGFQGDGYQLTPIVEVSGADLVGGTDATIEAYMEWNFTNIKITNGGSNYADGENISIFVEISYSDGTNSIPQQVATVKAVGNQLPTGDLVPVTMNGSPKTTKNVDGFNVIFVGGSGSGAAGELERAGKVYTFQITNQGSGYTSIPTIQITGGSPTQNKEATLEISAMSFRYSFDLDNANVSHPYVVLPEIMYDYQINANGGMSASSSVALITLDSDGFEDLTAYLTNLETGLMVSGDQLLFDNDNYFGTIEVQKARTNQYSYNVPVFHVKEPMHEQAQATVLVNIDGEVTGLGSINTGKGYSQEFDVTLNTISGLMGTGASIDLLGFSTNSRTGEVSWGGGYIKVAGGANYVDNANISAEECSHDVNPVLTVKNGETKVVNINYGTGARTEDVE